MGSGYSINGSLRVCFICVIKQGNYVILVVHWKERSPGEIGGKVDLIGDSNN